MRLPGPDLVQEAHLPQHLKVHATAEVDGVAAAAQPPGALDDHRAEAAPSQPPG